MTFEIETTSEFDTWLDGLRDVKAKARLAGRVLRFAEGLFGNVEPVGEGVSESKFDFGPGYRVYFIQRGAALIVVLGGGDKSTQAKDIENAKTLARLL